MQKEKRRKYRQRSLEDRRKVKTFLLDERRVGPFCRRQANATLKKGKSVPKYWDWRSGQWRPIRQGPA
ncbi:MAG: hypothetical protein PVI54_19335 [Desulfobacteraceae bacterium]